MSQDVNKDIVNNIREDMRTACYYYCNKFKNTGEVQNYFSKKDINHSPSEFLNTDFNGITLLYDIFTSGSCNFHVRDMVRSCWSALGFEQEAKKAFKLCDERYLISGLKKYGMTVESYKIYKNRCGIKDDVYESGILKTSSSSFSENFMYFIAVVIFVALTSSLVGTCVGGGEKSGEETAHEAYCARLGRTSC